MRVAIVGAGAAGLASARHVSAQGIQCDVFEMGSDLGGIWIYTDSIDKDEYGYPIQTSMYKNLRTNLPKEIMGYPNFPFPDQEESFINQEDMLQYLNNYADHFKLRELIKFNEMVTEIRPCEDKWQIKSLYKPSKTEATRIYDAVMICNGHFICPFRPNLVGEKLFKGKIIHSYQYRDAEDYRNDRVLVVGAGFSGLDIAVQIASVADSVVVSHKPLKKEIKGEFPANLTRKPEILHVKNEQEIEFADGSSFAFDTIVYCTGYKYNVPFLHESCGVIVKDKSIEPLYKHIIHVDKPTMCFIGVPVNVCVFQMCDIQARYYCQYLNGSMSLPPTEVMRQSMEEDFKKRKSDEVAHILGPAQHEYFTGLAQEAKITPLALVITKIWSHCIENFFKDLKNFRNDKYRIVNDDSFIKFA